MANWSEEQIKAIETLDKSVLVSAAAGSGKTSVLVERIKKLVLEERVSLDRLLVVTFTKAAAGEMKERIIREIKKTILESPNAENTRYLKRQLGKIGEADISTIHSFASRIVRKYFYLADIDSNFKMGEETICLLMQKDAMDQVFQNLHEEGSQEFLEFIKGYSKITNSNPLKEELISLYLRVMSFVNPFEFLEKASLNYAIAEEEFPNSKLANHIFDYSQREINKSISFFEKNQEILDEANLLNLGGKNREDIQKLKEIKEFIEEKEFGKTKIALDCLKFEVMKAKAEEKADYIQIKEESTLLRKEGKELVESVKKRYFYGNLKELISTVQETKKSIEMVIRILQEFHKIYGASKREENILDFNDLEHFAVKILENQQVGEEYRNKFDYIFVDEYQDTNPIQEQLIASIERKDNGFRVGDIKQCIYGFRMSDPTIFKEKYELFKKEKEDSCKIDLNQNFRSKGRVIDGINKVFEKIMKDYNDEAKLNKGLVTEPAYEFPVELYPICEFESEKEEGEKIYEEENQLTSLEKEAVLISQIIKENLGREIYDSKGKVIKKIAEKDIVVLYRSGKEVAETIRRVLEAQNINAYLEDKEGYFETLEISIIVELLKCIDNRKKDLPLLATLRTDFFNFSTNDLMKIRMEYPKGYFYDGLVFYGEEGEEEELRNKCNRVIENLKEWKKRSFNTPINKFAWELMLETGLYEYIGSLKSGEKRQNNLRAFVDRANTFIDSGDGTVHGFLRYIELLQERKIDMGQSSIMNEKDNVVRIMTVHKSKGLEFPVVIMANLGKRLIKQGKKPLLEIDKELGVGMHLADAGKRLKKDTIIQRGIQDILKGKNLEEEKRILYVAFTRAKDKLILVGRLKSKETIDRLGEEGITLAGTYMEMIYPLRKHAQIKTKIIDQKEIELYHLEKEIEEKEGMKKIEESSVEVRKEIEKRLSYEYEESGKSLLSKTSVSAINKGEALEEIKIQSPEVLGEKSRDKNKGMIIGIVNHKFLEYIDFAKAREKGSEYLLKEKEILGQRNIINEEYLEYILVEKIEKLLKEPIFERIIKSKLVKKEQEFTIVQEKAGEEEQLIQGVIDCFFEEDEGLVLIDYKSNSQTENIEKEYKEQIKIYSRALEINYGKPVKEAYLALISKGKVIKVM